MYMMTPRDHMSHDLSYFSGPRTSGASKTTRHSVGASWLSVAADSGREPYIMAYIIIRVAHKQGEWLHV